MDDKGSIPIDVDGPSALNIELHVPHRELERRNFKETSEISFGNTYAVASLIALKGAVIDLQIGATLGINSPALEVACPPPGIGAKKVQENSKTAPNYLPNRQSCSRRCCHESL
jgi:hypothetical protein